MSNWREKEFQQQHEQNVQMYGTLKRAMLAEAPAVSGGITYKKVSAIIYRKAEKGRFLLQVELTDRSCGSVTIAAPRFVTIENADSLPEPVIPKDERFTQLSAVLKEALLSGVPVFTEEEEFTRLTAIYYRKSETGGFKIEVELEAQGGEVKMRTEPVTAKICDRESSAEACRLDREGADAQWASSSTDRTGGETAV